MKELEKNYPLMCPVCKVIQHAEPSISMKLGGDSGHGSCSNCGEYLHLTLKENGLHFDVETWDQYLERIRMTNDDVKFFEDLLKTA